jgi:hypothetical protein
MAIRTITSSMTSPPVDAIRIGANASTLRNPGPKLLSANHERQATVKQQQSGSPRALFVDSSEADRPRAEGQRKRFRMSAILPTIAAMSSSGAIRAGASTIVSPTMRITKSSLERSCPLEQALPARGSLHLIVK